MIPRAIKICGLLLIVDVDAYKPLYNTTALYIVSCLCDFQCSITRFQGCISSLYNVDHIWCRTVVDE